MGLGSVDKDLDHLYPDFRTKLERVLGLVSQATGDEWYISEGYRSPERQLWLYAQGRTRPGKIVTWMKTPKWHGTGLAADVLPRKKGYGAPMAWWKKLREIYQQNGLSNPAWGNGDLGHVQLSDLGVRAKSLEWVRRGFPGSAHSAPAPPPKPPPEVPVIVNGVAVGDADGFLRDGHVFAALRPVVDALDWSIAGVKGKIATVVDDASELAVPIEIREGRGFAELRHLKPLADKMEWTGGKLVITDAHRGQ